MMSSYIMGAGRVMKRTPMRVVASVKRGMSGHATVEEATAEMHKWQKISAAGLLRCGAYGVFAITTLEHAHAKEGPHPEYMKIRAKPFPWKSCPDCELFNPACWKACGEASR
eukprot:UN10509